MGKNPFLQHQTHESKDSSPTRARDPRDKSVSKFARSAGKRVGGAMRAEFARAQKRRDMKGR